MMDFLYYLPVHLIFGRGKINQVGIQTARYEKKAFLVTGKSSARSGLLDAVQKYLEAAGVEAVVFDEVTPNPLTTTAIEAVKIIKEQHCDVVIGLGGGSVLDAAKGMAFLAGNHGSIDDYIFGKEPDGEALPIILVPTTCGTGSEGNSFAVFTNPQTKDKKSLRRTQLIAKASIIDSTLMETMPKNILSSVGLDAFCHNMEGYLSKNAQPITDLMAADGMRRVVEALPKLLDGNGTPDDWDYIALASTYGGMVINTAGVTACHGMEHPVSGLKDITHGHGLAALLPSIATAYIPGSPARSKEVATILGETDAENLTPALSRFLQQIERDYHLSDFGIGEKDIPWLTENTFHVSVASIELSPVSLDAEQIAQLYRTSL